jgi:AGCS family alanine or glycine:cation symporter
MVAFVGATTQLSIVWSFSDVMNGMMAIPNLIGLLVLSGLIARETRAYLKFDPKLRATEMEIRAALNNDPGYREWLVVEGEEPECERNNTSRDSRSVTLKE